MIYFTCNLILNRVMCDCGVGGLRRRGSGSRALQTVHLWSRAGIHTLHSVHRVVAPSRAMSRARLTSATEVTWASALPAPRCSLHPRPMTQHATQRTLACLLVAIVPKPMVKLSGAHAAMWLLPLWRWRCNPRSRRSPPSSSSGAPSSRPSGSPRCPQRMSAPDGST